MRWLRSLTACLLIFIAVSKVAAQSNFPWPDGSVSYNVNVAFTNGYTLKGRVLTFDEGDNYRTVPCNGNLVLTSPEGWSERFIFARFELHGFANKTDVWFVTGNDNTSVGTVEVHLNAAGSVVDDGWTIVEGSNGWGGSGKISPAFRLPTFNIDTPSIPAAASGLPYSVQLHESYGQGGWLKWELGPGTNLPTNWYFSSSGILSYNGRPAVPLGTYKLVALVTDHYGNKATRTYNIIVRASPLPLLRVTDVTTKDSSSITVHYRIDTAELTGPLTFDFYRSPNQSVSATAVKIGSATIPATDLADLATGDHYVRLLKGVNLPPTIKPTSTSLAARYPYVYAVAHVSKSVLLDPSSVTSGYFHKFLYGYVVHGYSFSDADTKQWVNALAASLKQAPFHCDQAFPFLWLSQSTTATTGLARQTGDSLAQQISSDMDTISQMHTGDVLDLVLVGHSRGTIVLGCALSELASLYGSKPSYISVNLLDVHPANPAADDLMSGTSILANNAKAFQDTVQDPEINVPADPRIKSVNVYFQQTPATYFSLFNSGSFLNLWGESPGSGKIVFAGGVPVTYHNLSSLYSPATDVIGHTSIHEYFRIAVAEAQSVPLQPLLRLFSISPGEVKSGNQASGTLTILIPGNASETITLKSLSPFIEVPQSVILPAGAKSVTFPITTTQVALKATGYIEATGVNGVSLSAKVILDP